MPATFHTSKVKKKTQTYLHHRLFDQEKLAAYLSAHSVVQCHPHFINQTDSCLSKYQYRYSCMKIGEFSHPSQWQNWNKRWKGETVTNTTGLGKLGVKHRHKHELGFGCSKTEIKWVSWFLIATNQLGTGDLQTGQRWINHTFSSETCKTWVWIVENVMMSFQSLFFKSVCVPYIN